MRDDGSDDQSDPSGEATTRAVGDTAALTRWPAAAVDGSAVSLRVVTAGVRQASGDQVSQSRTGSFAAPSRTPSRPSLGWSRCS